LQTIARADVQAMARAISDYDHAMQDSRLIMSMRSDSLQSTFAALLLALIAVAYIFAPPFVFILFLIVIPLVGLSVSAYFITED